MCCPYGRDNPIQQIQLGFIRRKCLLYLSTDHVPIKHMFVWLSTRKRRGHVPGLEKVPAGQGFDNSTNTTRTGNYEERFDVESTQQPVAGAARLKLLFRQELAQSGSSERRLCPRSSQPVSATPGSAVARTATPEWCCSCSVSTFGIEPLYTTEH